MWRVRRELSRTEKKMIQKNKQKEKLTNAIVHITIVKNKKADLKITV